MQINQDHAKTRENQKKHENMGASPEVRAIVENNSPRGWSEASVEVPYICFCEETCYRIACIQNDVLWVRVSLVNVYSKSREIHRSQPSFPYIFRFRSIWFWNRRDASSSSSFDHCVFLQAIFPISWKITKQTRGNRTPSVINLPHCTSSWKTLFQHTQNTTEFHVLTVVRKSLPPRTP